MIAIGGEDEHVQLISEVSSYLHIGRGTGIVAISDSSISSLLVYLHKVLSTLLDAS